jgi:hypothetical protein
VSQKNKQGTAMNDLTTTQTELASSRERFEQSGITKLLSRSTEPGFADEYADSHTQFAWRAWQVAERQALGRAIEALNHELTWRKGHGEYEYENGLWAAIDEIEDMRDSLAKEPK